jgi:hypothetical protein
MRDVSLRRVDNDGPARATPDQCVDTDLTATLEDGLTDLLGTVGTHAVTSDRVPTARRRRDGPAPT